MYNNKSGVQVNVSPKYTTINYEIDLDVKTYISTNSVDSVNSVWKKRLLLVISQIVLSLIWAVVKCFASSLL